LSDRWRLLIVLLALGVGWGATQPLGKIAVSSGHKPFGLIFWQLVICTLVLGAISLIRGRGLVWRREALIFAVVVAFLGTLVPGATFYMSVTHLPAGIMSILISSVPMLSYPIALALRMDGFSTMRLAGLLLGLAGVALIAAPGAGLLAVGLVIYLPLAMMGPLFYALEGIYLARSGTAGMDAVQAMFMASLAGAILCLPVTLATGAWIDPTAGFGRPEAALVLASLAHAFCYAGFVWLTAFAGPVFASQCAYLVTAAGVFWAMLILGERFSPMIWLALVIMLAGVALVQPRVRGKALT
jgi:drug/metabolite transporter (DMT)-like permease